VGASLPEETTEQGRNYIHLLLFCFLLISLWTFFFQDWQFNYLFNILLQVM
jgi:hypothetical protein